MAQRPLKVTEEEREIISIIQNFVKRLSQGEEEIAFHSVMEMLGFDPITGFRDGLGRRAGRVLIVVKARWPLHLLAPPFDIGPRRSSTYTVYRARHFHLVKVGPAPLAWWGRPRGRREL